jgi:mRNA degradation ribonuclease J1/J2
MHAQTNPCPERPATLEAMRDCYRPLILFAPSAGDVRLTQQLQELSNHVADLRERNILVVINVADHQTVVTSNTQTLHATQLGSNEDSKLRDRFKISSDGFVVLLVGKDGGEKLRRQKIVTVETLNRTIDAMPMRQAEQKQ